MAREGFKKEQELLRLLFLDGGGMNRSQLASRLGISIDGLDKTMQQVKILLEESGYSESCLVSTRKRHVHNYLRYDYYESGENFFYCLYSNKAMKESESIRLALILVHLQAGPASKNELLEYLSQHNEFVEERNLRDYLNYLMDMELIERRNYPAQYYLCQNPLHYLNEEQLLELYDYLNFCLNTSLLAFPGFVLYQAIKQILLDEQYPEQLNACLYRYSYLLRVLEEHWCYQLVGSIARRKAIRVHYLRKKDDQRYYADPVKKEKGKSRGLVCELIPLRLMYDHQFGRWYLLACDKKGTLESPLRVDNILKIEQLDHYMEQESFDRACHDLEQQLQHSWLLAIKSLTRVRVRFYFDPLLPGQNFIRRRVETQGRWGKIIEDNTDNFIYEIELSDSAEIKPWIRSFGSSAEVLEPLELRNELAGEWRQLEALYESV